MFNKIFEKPIQSFAKKELAPVRRLFQGNNPMGAVHRTPDTRTVGELTQTIDYYASKIPEVKQFANDIKSLSPKHIGLIADTLELSSYHALLTKIEAGLDNVFSQTAIEKLIPEMIKASKDNPEAMELVEAIINNTDAKTSKYALYSMSNGILNNKALAKHMSETAKITADIADETLDGMYQMDFSKQNHFMNYIKLFVNPNTVPEKIVFLFKDFIKVTDSINGVFKIDVGAFVTSKVPLEKIRENLAMLPELAKKMGLKPEKIDTVEFVTKNVNLK